MNERELPLWALLVANLLPVAGVLFWSWDVAALVLLYWVENLIHGFYTILRMLIAAPVGGLFSSAFFLLHYGGFCAVHGMFILALLLDVDAFSGETHWPFLLVFVELLVNVVRSAWQVAPDAWLFAALALFISHGVSFVVHYIAPRAWRESEVQKLMSEPYGRVMILHVAILAGGFAVAALGEPAVLLVALIALKLVIDVWAHIRRHNKAGTKTGTAEAEHG